MVQQLQPPFFGETFALQRSPYSITIQFRAPGMQQFMLSVSVPPTVAKQLAMVLRKHVLDHEASFGPLVVPPDSWKAMGVVPEDWGDLKTPSG